MQVSRYQPSYRDLLDMMYETHHRTLDVIDLPQIGFIATEGSIPVAIGFLRPSGLYGIVDYVITNNDLPLSMQMEGKGLVVKAINETSKSLNLKPMLWLLIDN